MQNSPRVCWTTSRLQVGWPGASRPGYPARCGFMATTNALPRPAASLWTPRAHPCFPKRRGGGQCVCVVEGAIGSRAVSLVRGASSVFSSMQVFWVRGGVSEERPGLGWWPHTSTGLSPIDRAIGQMRSGTGSGSEGSWAGSGVNETWV